MTNPMFNPQPNYSGVTIQIANPSVYANGSSPQIQQGRMCEPNYVPQQYCQGVTTPNSIGEPAPVGFISGNPQQQPPQNYIPPQAIAYPPQYYLNNYNYQNLPTPTERGNSSAEADKNSKYIEDDITKNNEPKAITNAGSNIPNTQDGQDLFAATSPEQVDSTFEKNKPEHSDLTENQTKDTENINNQEDDMTKSTDIIDDLDQRAAAAEALKNNKKKDGIVPLTDEYIKSLENYLNNPNDEIRLMAAKEILTRLDEDKDRYDDAALNALLNKMLQDPSKLIRVASLSAFASQLASGNNYTVTLLHNIQQNPNADKEDVLQAADILLKMSAGKEITDIPTPSVKDFQENKG